MIILANFLGALSTVLEMVFNLLLLLVTIRVVLSWVNPDPYNPIVRFIVSTTDPLLELMRPLRGYLNKLGGGRMDWTPLVLVLIIVFLQHFLVANLQDYALQIRLRSIQGE